MRTLCVIHHTHTDIGYTELQGRDKPGNVDSALRACRDMNAGIVCFRQAIGV